MPVQRLKAAKVAQSGQATSPDVAARVRGMLDELAATGEEAARRFGKDLDGWEGDIIVSKAALDAAIATVPAQVRADIDYAHGNVRRFAEAQKATLTEFETELSPGVFAGQRQIPVSACGAYVPGGRYSHIASCIMTITTAKVAGCKHVTVCSPPSGRDGIPAAMLYAMHVCGADAILNMGGVQGIAALAHGFFGLPKADILVGPGNQYVAEAKRLLYGTVGIDMFAGPTESMVVADATADADIVAADLVSQAEHGYNSPTQLVTTDRRLGEAVLARMQPLMDTLPALNAENASAAWRDHGEVILCDTREEMAEVADEYSSEHLHVQAEDLDWWRDRLRSYGSLFLGQETTVSFGDKAAGPNHVLPTSGAARYTGGLSVHKFTKTVTWQRVDKAALPALAGATARISRQERMYGHAMAADVRLEKYFPGEVFDLGQAP